MICDIVARSSVAYSTCIETEIGSRVQTTCLYPSFDAVAVFVVRYGLGFIVHDGGGAMHSALQHGRDPKDLLSALRSQATRYGLEVARSQLSVKCESADWLPSAILAVSNASAAAANAVIDMDLESEIDDDPDLRAEVREVLMGRFEKRVTPRYRRNGRTGKRFTFDFAVSRGPRIVLIDAVTPNSTSVAFKYTAFANVGARALGGAIAVHNRPLKPEDALMLQEVADVMPVAALADNVERELYVEAA